MVHLCFTYVKKGEEAYWSYTSDHCQKVDCNNRIHLTCKDSFWRGISRMKHHLAGTRKEVKEYVACGDKIHDMFRKILEKLQMMKGIEESFAEEGDGDDEMEIEGGGKNKSKTTLDGVVIKGGVKNPKQNNTVNTMLKKKERDEVFLDICRCL